MTEAIEPHRVTRPIQLLAAWLVGLIAIESTLLAAARLMTHPGWAAGFLVISSVAVIPLFLLSIFLLQTRFRPEMQEDSYYSEYLKQRVDSALGKGFAQTSRELDPGDAEFVGVLADNMLPYLRETESGQSSPRSSSAVTGLWRRAEQGDRSRRSDEQIRRMLRSWPPPEEAQDALAVLESLSEDDRDLLYQYGEDEYAYRAPGRTGAPGFYGGLGSSPGQLLDRGLVAANPNDIDFEGEPLIALTDEGRRTVRLMMADGEPPNYLDPGRVAAIRPSAERIQRERAFYAEQENRHRT